MKKIFIIQLFVNSLLFTSLLQCFTNPLWSNNEHCDLSEKTQIVQIVGDSKKAIHIKSYALNMLGALVLEEAEKKNTEYIFSEEVLQFCKKVIENQKNFTVDELARVVPELALYFENINQKIKAPRPDAPGNTDGSPVGALLECDFSEILQLLNKLTRIVNQCCAILQQDFQFTWTILADITSTITNDFNGTFTFLNEINTTLTTCYASVQNDFIGVFTSLTEVNDTLTTCCANIQTDFNGVFTLIATIDMDFSGVFTTLTEVNDTLTTCCADIQTDFNGVFTLIAAIDMDFGSVFTTLNEINDTLTACCTILETDFDDVFATLGDIQTTLTTCCIETQINFEGTFTVLDTLKSGQCFPTSITASGIISTSGYYCLANDIAGSIEIAASNVTLDLNNHTISGAGVIVNGVTNVSVGNGRISGPTIGVQLVGGSSGVILSNLLITDCSDTGIQVGSASSSVILNDIMIDGVTNLGVSFIGLNNNCNCTQVTVRRLTGSYGFGTAGTGLLNDSFFIDCRVINSTIAVATCNCFAVQGNNNEFINCSVQGVSLNTAGTLSGFLVANNSLMDNCNVQSLSGSGASSVFGFSTANASYVIFRNCTVTNLLSPDIAQCFSFQGVNTNGAAVCIDCVASGCSGVSETAGFYSNSGMMSLNNCQAYQITGGDGFFMFGDEGTVMINCTASLNGANGFNTGTSEVVVGNCVATQNTGFGFNTSSGGPLFYSCFATGNSGGNYAAAIANQSATSSTLSRGNTFL